MKTRDLVALSSRGESSKLTKFFIARDMAVTVWGRYKSYRVEQARRNLYYVSIEEDEDLYERVQNKLIKEIDPRDRHSLIAFTRNEWDNLLDTQHMQLMFTHDEKFSTTVDIAGFTIPVRVTRMSEKDTLGVGEPTSLFRQLLNIRSFEGTAVAPTEDVASLETYARMSFTNRLVFTCKSVEQRDAVVDWITEVADAMSKVKRQSRFFVASSTGHWNRRSVLPGRRMDTVILPGNDTQRITEDVEFFLSQKLRYRDMGIPWHHGYLFHGPPGTGKTSVASGIATETDSDVYYIPLKAVENDSKLQDLISSISSERAVLLLEDIDIAHAARDRDDAQHGVTMQGLLNALDGVATPEGLISIMTTNNRTVLDPALVRSGRVDFEIEIGYLQEDQLDAMVRRFHGHPHDLPPIVGDVPPSDIVGVFKDTTDCDEVVKKLHAILTEKAYERATA